MKYINSLCLLGFLVLTGCAASKPAGKIEHAPNYDGSDRKSKERARISARGMVVADDRLAAEWGSEILAKGGNAVDAAVATAFYLSVTRPHYASLGGGGFFLFCPEKEKCSVIDYRETAPAALTIDRYRNADGKLNQDLAQDGARASGVPGVVAGLLEAHRKWGRLQRSILLSEPIRIAKLGFPFTSYMETVALERWDSLNDEAKIILGCRAGETRTKEIPNRPCLPGQNFKQPDLALVLSRIAERGSDGFYRGETARALVAGLKSAEGLLTLQDLETYRSKERAPLEGEAYGMKIISMPPPSSGGAILLELLHDSLLAEEAMKKGFGSSEMLQAVGHAQSLAFSDRAKYFGDPDFTEVPLAKLLDPLRLDARWKETFDLTDARSADLVREPTETTHFVAADRAGNMVSITTTINDNFGSAFVPPGTGVFMNNQMDDFSLEPGVPNLAGLIGREANALKPGKRPLSSMCPTIVRTRDGSNRIAIGGAGGPRIPTAVHWALLARLRYGMSLADAVAAPRLHHQWRPKTFWVDRYGFSTETLERLVGLGWEIKEATVGARLHGLERVVPASGDARSARLWGAPDPRGEGDAAIERP